MTKRVRAKSRAARGVDGAGGSDGLSQDEIALRLGISRARVSQIEIQAFQKMRALVKPEFLDLLRTSFPTRREEVPIVDVSASGSL